MGGALAKANVHVNGLIERGAVLASGLIERGAVQANGLIERGAFNAAANFGREAFVGVQHGAIRIADKFVGVQNGAIRTVGIEAGAIRIKVGDNPIAVIGLILIAICLVFQQSDKSGNMRLLLQYLNVAIVSLVKICGLLAASIVAAYYISRNSRKREVRKIIAKTDLILIGNPGAGKSTILNGLLGDIQFKSGPCLDGSLTGEFLLKTDAHGNSFMDTPGLSDFKTRKDAAAEITKAIKKSSQEEGSLKLIFVLTLESGRVRATDTTTMKLVLDALPQNTQYGILVNQIYPKIVDKLYSDQDNLDKLYTCLNQGRQNKTVHIHLIEIDKNLENMDNAALTPSSDLIQFINLLPSSSLNAENIKGINATEMGDMIEKMTNQIENLNKDRQYLNECIKNDKIALKEQAKNREEKYTKEIENLRKQLKNSKSRKAKDVDVGPIYGNYEAVIKVNRWLKKNPEWQKDGWEWNGQWVSKNGTSYAGMVQYG